MATPRLIVQKSNSEEHDDHVCHSKNDYTVTVTPVAFDICEALEDNRALDFPVCLLSKLVLSITLSMKCAVYGVNPPPASASTSPDGAGLSACELVGDTRINRKSTRLSYKILQTSYISLGTSCSSFRVVGQQTHQGNRTWLGNAFQCYGLSKVKQRSHGGRPADASEKSDMAWEYLSALQGEITGLETFCRRAGLNCTMLLGHKQRRAFGDVLTRELSLQSASLGSASKLCPAGHSKLSPMPVKLNGTSFNLKFDTALYVLHPINVIGNNTNKLTNFGSTVAMRFTVAAAVLSVVASSSAMALTERQVGVSNNLVCVTMTLPLLGTQNLAFCSDGTCTTALILGANEIAGLPLGASLNIGNVALVELGENGDDTRVDPGCTTRNYERMFMNSFASVLESLRYDMLVAVSWDEFRPMPDTVFTTCVPHLGTAGCVLWWEHRFNNDTSLSSTEYPLSRNILPRMPECESVRFLLCHWDWVAGHVASNA
ncbi:hypothetical protein BC629DRAFT_1436745 [Irpex lacteus]|nr:hypothetical protein BC629DRAFT_1436745 [Irpex lacteus]